MSTSIKIGNTEFGYSRAGVIAEIAQAHDGSLGTAHAFIDAAADAGADAVKFQTHIAAAESTSREDWRVKFSRQDATRFDYWKRMEFTEPQWHGLKAHAVDRGLLFLSSPFSPEAVELLQRVGVPAWKVASGEVTNRPLLQLMRDTGLPMLISSGMSSSQELDRAVQFCRERGAPVAVFQCTTAYPCPPEKIGLNLLSTWRERYGVPVGLSDHSGTIYPGLAAVTLGAALVEVHVTFHRKMFGPDVTASLTLEELAELVRGIRFIGRMKAAPVNKDVAAEAFGGLRALFGKSVVVSRGLPAGHELGAADLACKKPGDGIPASEMDRVVGRRLARPLAADDAILWNDLL